LGFGPASGGIFAGFAHCEDFHHFSASVDVVVRKIDFQRVEFQRVEEVIKAASRSWLLA